MIALVRVLLLVALIATPASAQTSPEEPRAGRPRIGLVLSGGGARGTAHVGVLQVLEELRIPIDCIAGTSMGAIVGGLYAYGRTTAELEQLVTRRSLTTTWQDLLRDGGPFVTLPFRRKEEAQTYLAGPKFGIRNGSFRLPKGLLQGQNLETELRLLTLAAHDLPTFDDLPIPFRCTAVDVRTGKKVVLDRGNLADAMRASMSLPGIFAPARIDGRDLLDGGLADNVPIAVARAMNVDVLIVIDIGTPVDSVGAASSVLDVSLKVMAILTQQNVDHSLARMQPGDLLIRPDLGDITSKDFERAAKAIAIGRAAAIARADDLRRWSLPRADYDAHREAQQRRPMPPPRLASLSIANDSSLSDDMLRARTSLRAGEPFDEAQLREDLDRLFAIDLFQRVRFDVTPRGDGSADLRLQAEEKDWGPSFMTFGLSLQTDAERSSFQLAGLHVARGLDQLGAELRTVAEIGERTSLGTEWYQPLSTSGRWFVAPRALARESQLDVYQNGAQIAEQQLRQADAGLDLGLSLGSLGELRAGYVRLFGESDIGLTTAPLADSEFDDGYLRLRAVLDTKNAAYFATAGSHLLTEYRHADLGLQTNDRFHSLLVRADHAVTIGDVTLVPAIEFDTMLEGQRPEWDKPSLGGFLRLSGLPVAASVVQHLALARLGGRVPVSSGLVPVHVGATVELASAWQSRDQRFDDTRLGGSVFAALETPIGPLYLGLGLADGGESTGFLLLGPGF